MPVNQIVKAHLGPYLYLIRLMSNLRRIP